jgi:hypothetical protein
MRPPSQTTPLPPLTFVPLCLLVATSCSQAAITRSAGDIISGVVLAGGPSSGTSAPGRAPSATRVIGEAEQFLGVPYKWGGSTPETGFDCSGYVRYVYAEQGVRLPRTSREQARAGEGLAPRVSSLRQGDLMLFAESSQPISHVAIYAGGGRIIHSSSSGGGVRYDVLATKRGQWYVDHMVAARRLAVDGRSLVQSLEFLARPNIPFDPPDHAPAPPRR